jgi:hypothetical protein
MSFVSIEMRAASDILSIFLRHKNRGSDGMHLLKTVIVQQKTDLQPSTSARQPAFLWPLALQNSLEMRSIFLCYNIIITVIFNKLIGLAEGSRWDWVICGFGIGTSIVEMQFRGYFGAPLILRMNIVVHRKVFLSFHLHCILTEYKQPIKMLQRLFKVIRQLNLHFVF